jgi:hypothetical protein
MTKLDSVVAPVEQARWLATPASTPTRLRPDGDWSRTGGYRADYEQLISSPGWPTMRRILRTYLERCIIEPHATEGDFWSATCWPSRVRINLHGQEVFAAALSPEGEVSCQGHARLSLLESVLHRKQDWPANYHWIEKFEGRDFLYKAGGKDQIRFETQLLKERQDLEILDDPEALLAIKSLTLDLMRKGANSWKRFHCVELIDDVMRDVRPRVDEALQSLDDLQRRAIAELAEAVRYIPEHAELRREAVQRIGQEIFRKMLDARWGNRCPLSQIDDRRLLRASHIKPWADCDPDDPAKERLNPHNGLLLAAHLDAAFDAGLISFGDDGRLFRSPELSSANFAALGVAEGASVELEEDSKPFLSWHRAKHGYE